MPSGLSKKDEPSQINRLLYSMGDRADDILYAHRGGREEKFEGLRKEEKCDF